MDAARWAGRASVREALSAEGLVWQSQEQGEAELDIGF
jgi:hypothetical protein